MSNNWVTNIRHKFGVSHDHTSKNKSHIHVPVNHWTYRVERKAKGQKEWMNTPDYSPKEEVEPTEWENADIEELHEELENAAKEIFE